MKKLLLVFLALLAVVFVSVRCHGIGCGHGSHYGGLISHGGHAGGSVKGHRDYEAFKGGLVGHSGYGGFPGGYQGSFGNQIGYSLYDIGSHRTPGGRQGSFAIQSGQGISPVVHRSGLVHHSGNFGDQDRGFKVSSGGQDGFQSSVGGRNYLAGSTVRQHGVYKGGLGGHDYQSGIESHQISVGGQNSFPEPTGGRQDRGHSSSLGGQGGSRGGYKGGLGGHVDHPISFGDQGSLGKSNSDRQSDAFDYKGGLGRSRSQSAYGGYDADHGGYGAHGGYIIQEY